MMLINDVLAPERVFLSNFGSSKKRVLQTLSSKLAASLAGINDNELFDRFIDRERLGSTALGKGIAIPHCRLSQLDKIVTALIFLEEAVPFEAPDQQPVDLLFVLVVPETEHQAHLDLLAAVVERFNNTSLVNRLRRSQSSDELYQHFMSPLPK